jgi:histidinol-phosphate/aromatic aminotransferase/cobyric acid decarboxylase-like protein
LTERQINYIPPQGNFIVIETGQDARQMQAKMIAKGFAIGRRFDTLEKMTRVTIGTDAEMAKFRQAFSESLTS